jgi:predicted SPOUT superfamily RNA methylase MTH1
MKKPTMVDTGLPKKIPLHDYDIPSKTRVTIKFASRDRYDKNAEPVDPAEPREQAGYYWGYSVRRCGSLSTVFTECPFEGGYDLSVGTSERGSPISRVLEGSSDPITPFRHLLVVFGGVAGIEAAVAADPELLDKGVTPATAGDLFDHWVNVLPDQGSRTIRTEEAVWLGLMGLRGLVERNG